MDWLNLSHAVIADPEFCTNRMKGRLLGFSIPMNHSGWDSWSWNV
jgi:hypothetical protein